MSNQKKTHELIRQNEQIVKKSQKHDANLQKNSTLYFQIGLIVCLLSAYGLLEMNFETTLPKDYSSVMHLTEVEEISIKNFDVYVEPKVEVKQQQVKKVLLIDEPKIVENDYVIKKVLEIDTPDIHQPTQPIDSPNAIQVVEKPTFDEKVPFIMIQNAPIYPGCESKKNNAARKKCMSEKISKLIKNKFNGGDIASDNDLFGRQKIDVQFTIDKTGHVTDVKTRAPHPKLEKEALRVINFIPKMTPGKQRDKNVGVIYTLPILFDVQ